MEPTLLADAGFSRPRLLPRHRRLQHPPALPGPWSLVERLCGDRHPSSLDPTKLSFRARKPMFVLCIRTLLVDAISRLVPASIADPRLRPPIPRFRTANRRARRCGSGSGAANRSQARPTALPSTNTPAAVRRRRDIPRFRGPATTAPRQPIPRRACSRLPHARDHRQPPAVQNRRESVPVKCASLRFGQARVVRATSVTLTGAPDPPLAR